MLFNWARDNILPRLEAGYCPPSTLNAKRTGTYLCGPSFRRGTCPAHKGRQVGFL